VRVTIITQDSLTPTVVPSLRVRKCERQDAACALGGPVVMTNGAGAAQFVFPAGPTGFDGYFEVSDPKGERGPVLVFVYPLVTTHRVVGVPSFTHRARADLLSALRSDLPASSAFVLARALDCTRSEGAGVRFDLDPRSQESIGFYLDNRLPVVSALDTVTDDMLAAGGFAGVAQSATKLHAKVPALALRLFDLGVYVRPETVTFVEYAPRP
jgi:hypothetical protein